MASSSSSSSSSTGRWEYDVFLSFHGDDTRKTFVAFLYSMLSERGCRTFIDNKELERGKSISPELVKNINESRIAVIVFSTNYASSSWCLDELVEILECWKNKEQIVLPLFYNVKPSDVKEQTGKFGEAFNRKHEGIHTAERWRAALKEAAEISGWDLDDAANGDWGVFIEQIVQHISSNLETEPFVDEHEVGIDCRANKLIRLLNKTSNDKPFVGIWGTGGIGKTTVARAVFKKIKNKFERSCFLENVREKSTAQLQKQLLRAMNSNVKISNHDMGVNEIKKRLHNKKILIVLDDVEDDNQLLNLVGKRHNWFGSESRIIITTRNKWVLKKFDAKICEAKLLDDNEALELFSLHAFKKKCPKAEFLDLSNCVKDYAQNLPLALRVLGSHLCQRSKAHWESELDKLMRNPPKEVQDVLKISFKGLHEDEKSIFLDIACFFKGYDINIAMDSFQSIKSLSEPRIKVLIERSLITISKCNTFLMHDLIQKMGREIVRQESKDLAKRSRLWLYKDICEVFDGDTVPKNIEGIMLTEVGEQGLNVNLDVLLMMKKLRILIISNGVKLIGCPEFLPKQLRCVKWKGYPGECLPLLPKSLVRLELPYSHIKQIPLSKNFHMNLKVINLRGCKYLVETLNFYELPCLEELDISWCGNVVEVEFHGMMENLRRIDLAYCNHLKKSPNLSRLPCLEQLYLEFCKNLVEVDPSLEFHERLVKLWLTGCEKLRSFATRINLKSLRKLELSYCSKLEKFPEIQGDIECLQKLDLRETAIKELPPSIKHLKGLRHLWVNKMLESLPNSIGGMKRLRSLTLAGSCIRKLPSSIAQLTRLTELNCNGCNLDEESILNLPHSLRDLNLSRSSFASLPASFTQLTNLGYLNLDGCLNLQTLESLPPSIQSVSAQGCVSLERYSIPTSGKWIFIENHKLVENHGKNKPNIYSESLLEDIGDTCIVLPGGEIPRWFNHICESGEDRLCLTVSPNSCTNLKGIAVCAVIGIDYESPDYWDTLSLCINGFVEVHINRTKLVKSSSNHIVLTHRTHVLRPEPLMLVKPDKDYWLMGNSDACYIEVTLSPRNCGLVPLKVKKWGIHLVMDAPPPPLTQVYLDQLSATNKQKRKRRKRKRSAEEDH